MFIFDKYNFDSQTKIASFKYQLNELNFIEELDFSGIKFSDNIDKELINNVLFFLHLLLGISYYKLTLEKDIKITSGSLNQSQAEFFNILYTKGLGEFFYKNNINFHNLINFPFLEKSSFKKINSKNNGKSLVPVGGGKDSSVVLHILEKNKIPFEIFTLGDNNIYNEISKYFGKTPISVQRKIDPKIIELNKTGKYFNGHIPISSIIAGVSLFVSVLQGYKYIILANEQSSNIGNIIWNGMEINHQYSKSLEFEKLIQSFIQDNITDITYFSLLRPFTELKIAELFSKNCEKVFYKFSSCNTNFKLFKTQNINTNKWCLKCPKCAFVFVILAPFLGIQKTSDIFGGNLFNDKDLLDTFIDLIGYGKTKPFECVGIKEEVQVSFSKILEKENIKGMPVLEEIRKYNLEKDFDKYINSFEENLIPKEFKLLFE